MAYGEAEGKKLENFHISGSDDWIYGKTIHFYRNGRDWGQVDTMSLALEYLVGSVCGSSKYELSVES